MIERSEGIGSLNAIAPTDAKNNTKGKAPGPNTFFCTHHGADKGHNTANCFTLKIGQAEGQIRPQEAVLLSEAAY